MVRTNEELYEQEYMHVLAERNKEYRIIKNYMPQTSCLIPFVFRLLHEAPLFVQQRIFTAVRIYVSA